MTELMLRLFKKNKKVPFEISKLEVDMHCHVLPGIDDGAKNVEESIAIILALKKLGYSKIIATPHIYKEYYPNTKETIQDALDKLLYEVEKRSIDINIQASAEYMIDEHLEELIERNELLPFGDENYILLEFPFFSAPYNYKEIFFKLQTLGYQPILAHPERYTYWSKDIKKFSEISESGVILQLNMLSLEGHYGKQVRRNAISLIERGLIQFLGTDAHNIQHLEKLNDLKNQKLQKTPSCGAMLNSRLK